MRMITNIINWVLDRKCKPDTQTTYCSFTDGTGIRDDGSRCQCEACQRAAKKAKVQ